MSLLLSSCKHFVSFAFSETLEAFKVLRNGLLNKPDWFCFGKFGKSIYLQMVKRNLFVADFLLEAVSP